MKSYPIERVCKSYEAPYLREAKVGTTRKLLARASTERGRYALAKEASIKPSRVLEMVSMADLMRVYKVGTTHAMALRSLGVPTVGELKTRNPERLHAALLDVAGGFPPPLKFVERWVHQAKGMESIITYKIWH